MCEENMGRYLLSTEVPSYTVSIHATKTRHSTQHYVDTTTLPPPLSLLYSSPPKITTSKLFELDARGGLR